MRLNAGISFSVVFTEVYNKEIDVHKVFVLLFGHTSGTQKLLLTVAEVTIGTFSNQDGHCNDNANVPFVTELGLKKTVFRSNLLPS